MRKLIKSEVHKANSQYSGELTFYFFYIQFRTHVLLEIKTAFLI